MDARRLDILSNGPQAAAFDVVLMDLQMRRWMVIRRPPNCGSDARFAALPYHRHDGAKRRLEEKQRCLAAGMKNDHISKPIDPSAAVLKPWRGINRSAPGTSASVPPKRQNLGLGCQNGRHSHGVAR